ncbi:hypothetical protein YC2023_081660 [Brassica napus]
MCFLDSGVSTSPVFGSQAEDEHEMRARKIYYTKIDTKVTQTDIKLLFEAACGEAESAGESLKYTCLFPCYLCSPRHDILRGQPDAGFSLFPQSENMNLDDRGGKAWSCGGDGENVVWLFLGVANTSIILHDDEFLKYLKDHQENFRKLVRKKLVIDKAKNPRGMTLPKLCPNVCKVVVVTREQELVLCRGDVSNLSPSRLTRMLQSLTGMPSAAFEAKTLLYTADFKTIVLKYCGSLRKVEETDEP